MEVSGQPHAPATLPPETNSLGTHSIGSWRGPIPQQRKLSCSYGELKPKTEQPTIHSLYRRHSIGSLTDLYYRILKTIMCFTSAFYAAAMLVYLRKGNVQNVKLFILFRIRSARQVSCDCID